MKRHIAIALTAAGIIGASVVGASARGGHGGHGGHASFAHTGGSWSGAHVAAFHGSHMAFGHPFVGHRFHDHHRFRHRLFFVGGPYAYGYDDCYARVWTRWGWRWRYACY